MPELRDLPDLASDVRERAVPPAYQEVGRRVRARRLRGAAGTLAAVVLVIASVALWQTVATTAGPPVPQPADQTPTRPTDDSQWRAVVDGTDAHPFDISGSDDGSLAVVWRALEQPEPTFALVIREPDGTVHGIRLDTPVTLTPVPGGWVGLRIAQGFFITSDGHWTDLGDPGPARHAQPGDVFIAGPYGIDRLYSPRDQSWSTMPKPHGYISDGYVTPDGDLIVCGIGQGGVRAFSDDQPVVAPAVPGTACVLAGYGDDIALVGLGNDPDGGIPMTGLLLGIGGNVVVPRMTTMLEGVSSVVMTRDGTTVITDATTGDWYLIAADGHFRPVDRKVGVAFAAGERLYVGPYGLMNGPIFYSDDDGRTWQETVLPGNESSEE